MTLDTPFPPPLQMITHWNIHKQLNVDRPRQLCPRQLHALCIFSETKSAFCRLCLPLMLENCCNQYNFSVDSIQEHAGIIAFHCRFLIFYRKQILKRLQTFFFIAIELSKDTAQKEQITECEETVPTTPYLWRSVEK